MKQTVALIVLDGFGLGKDDESNPIYVAKPKNFAWLAENYPITSLQASGISVGLPWGEVGNSEVGHLTLGAGKVIYQYYPLITLAVKDESFFQNRALRDAFAHAKKNNSAVNLVGLLTKANVHASLEHVQALLKMAGKEGVQNVNLHLFADGKDSPPKTTEKFLAELPKEKLATFIGRYYALDRKGNWQLTAKAYDCLVGKSGVAAKDPSESLKGLYAKGLIEEFLPPLRIDPEKKIKDGDAVIFFHFREDSIRQLAEAFLVRGFDKFPVENFQNLYITTFTHYEDKFDVPVAFPAQNVEEPLGKVLEDAGKTQLRIAETYKYAHVTYFFNGHREPPFKNEYRVLIPSLNLTHPDEQPELMAPAITDRLVEAIEGQAFDFILANYANPDTIGHSGNYDAAMKTIGVLDEQLGRLLQVCQKPGITVLITSDHGNLEEMINPMTAEIETQHDASPVPLYLIGQEFKGKKFVNWENIRAETGGILSDVAPTILEIMGIPQPKEMDGHSLLRELTP